MFVVKSDVNMSKYLKNSSTGFPKFLVDRYPLDTVAGLHVPPKCCDVSLKQVVQLLHSCGPLFEIVRACGPQPGRYCSKSWCPLKKKKVFHLESASIIPILSQNHSVL